MNLEKTNHITADNLRQRLAGCRLNASPLGPDFCLEQLLGQLTTCRVIKENERRQVYFLETPQGGYFLKFTTLVRHKDKRRHRLLPFRKWSEWRNLHRLLKVGIAAAKPVVKGENKDSDPHFFFLLTEQLKGLPLKIGTAVDAGKMGEYLARLHAKGVLHADLHPANIIVTAGTHSLIDVQQVYFLPWIPRLLRAHNLGEIYFNLSLMQDGLRWAEEFIAGYNHRSAVPVSLVQLVRAAGRHRKKKYSSRSKRCCKNSTEFVVVNDSDLKGYKRKSFQWGNRELRLALEKGHVLKESHVISYQAVCIKRQRQRRFHKNRCFTSWKMSRALEVRGIAVPRALGYFEIEDQSYFLAELIDERLHLNAYLSALSDERLKRRAFKKLARWLRSFHDTDVWQRDFKSENILYCNGEYFMVDLDGVRIRRLSEDNIITNLAQLNASVSNAISLKDRIRFLHYYWANENPSRKQRRGVYRKVWEISRKKNTKAFGLDLTRLEL
jgi:tRNA A-37 threonylcarbamoyl transferase component Bud32